jgi:hypothetical protein
MFSSFYSKYAGLFLIIAAVLTACSNAPARRTARVDLVDLDAPVLPAVAAEFITNREGELPEAGVRNRQPGSETVYWRLWRSNDRIVIERPQLGLGELWQKDGQTLIHRKLFHADRRAVEFRQDDLDILGQAPSWQKLSLLVEPALLRQLQADEPETSDGGYILQEFRGLVGGEGWRVVMRVDVGLPVLIERSTETFSEHTQLLQAYPLAQAPWQPTADQGYRLIDYSDLGDMETDPFVIKLQALMGPEHSD